MIGNWWHYAQTPAGQFAHQLNPVTLQAEAERLVREEDPDLPLAEAEVEAIGDECERIRAELGFPPKGRHVMRAGWDSHVSIGEPHPEFLAKCVRVVRVGVDDGPLD